MSITASLPRFSVKPKEFLPGAKEMRQASAHSILAKLSSKKPEVYDIGVQELQRTGVHNFARTFEHCMFPTMLREVASEMRSTRNHRVLAAALVNTATNLEATLCNSSINGNTASRKTTLASYRAKLAQKLSSEFSEQLTAYPLGAKPAINFEVRRISAVQESVRPVFSLCDFAPKDPLFFQIKGTGFDGPHSWGFYVEMDKSTGIISKIFSEAGAREFLLTDLRVAICASNVLNIALTQHEPTKSLHIVAPALLSAPATALVKEFKSPASIANQN